MTRHLFALCIGAVLAIGGTGCIMGELWKTHEFEQVRTEYAYVAGTVRGSSDPDLWTIVFVARLPCDDDWRQLQEARDRGTLQAPIERWTPEMRALAGRVREKVAIASHVTLQGGGTWYARLAPGCYAVGAFEDLNRNYRYDENEPAAPIRADPEHRVFELRAGDRREGLDIVIPPDGRVFGGGADIAALQVKALQARTQPEQLVVSMDEVAVEGEIANLDDPRFGAESGRLGYFDIYTFAWKIHPGVYFLEPYDPKKIPVLFVHGATGHPSEFATLAKGLDRSRFQPWFFYYPSGARLDGVSDFLVQRIANLQLRYQFDRLAVVAHSMGGLVARSFVLKYHERIRTDPIRLFVSVSTPWGGMESATKGVANSPVVVPSWRDIAEGSDFLANLFFQDPPTNKVRRHPPASVPYYLIFGVEDRTISLPSGIRWEALRDAKERWPLPYDHTAILRSPELTTLLDEILARELRS